MAQYYPDIQGVRIQVKGRLQKSKRTQRHVFQFGRIRNQTITYPLKYGTEQAFTKYGSMGVKIWFAG